MSLVEQRQVTIEPIISYPHQAQAGKTYIMTIDLQMTTNYKDWPFDEEEYPIWFVINTDPLFSYEPFGTENQVVILHRFGGTYGPATFLLTAAQQEMVGTLSIVLVNDWGIPIEEIKVESTIIAANSSIPASPPVNYAEIVQSQERGEQLHQENTFVNRPQYQDDVKERFQTQSSSNLSLAPLNVFCCYTHNDESYLRKLRKYLKNLERQGLILTWHERDIFASADWEEKIETHFETASLILLLISPDFLASDFCYEIEMERALQRHDAGTARVLPIIVRPCDWPHSPFAHLQALPTDGRPIATWDNLDEAFVKVITSIRRAIEEFSMYFQKEQVPPEDGSFNRSGYEENFIDKSEAKSSSNPSSGPIKVFCSYAREDEDLLRNLEAHLSLLRRQGLISLWHGRKVVPPMDWAEEIHKQIEHASIFLLLISSDFMASDYCYGVEMQRALQRHATGEARVIPIAIRPADWKGAPFADLPALPTNGRPITTWDNQDEAFLDVIVGIRRIIEDLSLYSQRTSHAALPTVWNVPQRRNPYFTGRDELLNLLHQRLTQIRPNDTMAARRVALTQRQAICGLGGVGKTQIAIEYAYRYHDFYPYILWIDASSYDTLVTSFVALAELLPSFPAKDETDQRKLVENIKWWLEEQEQRWLLIFDNAEDVSLIRQFFPQRGNGSILLTTRARSVGGSVGRLDVEQMSIVEGTHFLLLRTHRFEQASDEALNEASNVVVALDAFPLALDQAGAYIEETGCGFEDYLHLYQKHRQELLARRGMQTTNYPDSVATTWVLSFHKIQQANPAAAELLRLCAFLAPDRIPEELLRDGAAHWPPSLRQAAADPLAFDQMIAELLKFSLVKRLIEDHALSIHPLVQAVQMDIMESEEQHEWAERVIRAVNKVFPNNSSDIAAWAQCLRSLDQVQACNNLVERYMLTVIEAADLLNRAGLYLNAQASYLIAEPLFQRALTIQVQPLGQLHPDVAITLSNLATLYHNLSRYSEAESLYQRALNIQEQVLGPDHPQVASSLSGLANLYRDQGQYSEAKPLYQRALHSQEQQLGSDHPQVASSLNGLANLYRDLGQYSEAEPLYQRALHSQEQQLGPEHPQVASSLNGLANLYHEQGKYAEAELLYRRALAIYEKQLGSEHPDTARSLNDLAVFYREQGKYAEAEPMLRRALEIREQQLGTDHPDTGRSLNNLAYLYDAQGMYAEAEPVYRRALAIYEKQLGADHPEMATSLNNLAVLYQEQSKYTEAEPLLKRALEIREQQLGKTHPNTAMSLNNLAMLYDIQGKYTEAEQLYQRALAIYEHALGPHHPQTRVVQGNYASLLQKMGHDINR